jgi:predicted nucleic acid-binding protein
VAFLQGEEGSDVTALGEALDAEELVLPPIVLMEVLSEPRLSEDAATTIKSMPLLALTPGFWERAGILRSHLLAKGRKAKVADAVIAQCCIDHEVSLITRDRDFAAFAQHGPLALVGLPRKR